MEVSGLNSMDSYRIVQLRMLDIREIEAAASGFITPKQG
jgi:hypothetical protein